MHSVDWGNGPGQIKAAERFDRATEILHERTGSWTTLADKGIDWVRKNHPDIAPGFDGLPFDNQTPN